MQFRKMQETLGFEPTAPAAAISPLAELGAYEYLWSLHNQSFKKIADLFRDNARPSELAPAGEAKSVARTVLELLRAKGVQRFGLRFKNTCDYPERLRDAANPVEILYFQGSWELLQAPSVAVVGTRHPTEKAISLARDLVRFLVKRFTIVSGLAAGIDTVAHETALSENGTTIAVIGTPLSEAYPRANSALQRLIARRFLLISQVPVYRYSRQIWKQNRLFFPERNITMSALTSATIIVEASDTSGTLAQARAAIHQGRKLFILDPCFEDKSLRWPRRFLEQGAIRVKDFKQIDDALAAAASPDR